MRTDWPAGLVHDKASNPFNIPLLLIQQRQHHNTITTNSPVCFLTSLTVQLMLRNAPNSMELTSLASIRIAAISEYLCNPLLN